VRLFESEVIMVFRRFAFAFALACSITVAGCAAPVEEEEEDGSAEAAAQAQSSGMPVVFEVERPPGALNLALERDWSAAEFQVRDQPIDGTPAWLRAGKTRTPRLVSAVRSASRGIGSGPCRVRVEVDFEEGRIDEATLRCRWRF
jgi:hypothetical protein